MWIITRIPTDDLETDDNHISTSYDKFSSLEEGTEYLEDYLEIEELVDSIKTKSQIFYKHADGYLYVISPEEKVHIGEIH